MGGAVMKAISSRSSPSNTPAQLRSKNRAARPSVSPLPAAKHNTFGFMSATRLLHEECFSHLCRKTQRVEVAEQIQLLFRLPVRSSSSLLTVTDMSSAHAGIPELCQ